jgi:hypothetical protein
MRKLALTVLVMRKNSSRFVPTDAIMNVWFEWVVFVCGNAQSCKKHCDWVFGVMFVKCSKLQKTFWFECLVFCLWNAQSCKKKKNIVIECFVFCLWKCSKLQKKKKHCDWWLSVLCFVCENAESCKTILRLWIEEISTYSFGGDEEEEELMKIFLYPLLQWMKRNTEKKRGSWNCSAQSLLTCHISDNKFQ